MKRWEHNVISIVVNVPFSKMDIEIWEADREIVKFKKGPPMEVLRKRNEWLAARLDELGRAGWQVASSSVVHSGAGFFMQDVILKREIESWE